MFGLIDCRANQLKQAVEIDANIRLNYATIYSLYLQCNLHNDFADFLAITTIEEYSE